MYPNGLNQEATDDEMNISFKPSPNYAALAEAASGSCSLGSSDQNTNQWMIGVQVTSVMSLKTELSKASKRVLETRKGMFIEALMP